MSDKYQDELTEKYRKFPDEANADAWMLQDACNLQAIAQTFLCMTRACDWKYDNPAVVMTLDKMMHLCHMQGTFYSKEQDKIYDHAIEVCAEAFRRRVKEKSDENKSI